MFRNKIFKKRTFTVSKSNSHPSACSLSVLDNHMDEITVLVLYHEQYGLHNGVFPVIKTYVRE